MLFKPRRLSYIFDILKHAKRKENMLGPMYEDTVTKPTDAIVEVSGDSQAEINQLTGWLADPFVDIIRYKNNGEVVKHIFWWEGIKQSKVKSFIQDKINYENNRAQEEKKRQNSWKAWFMKNLSCGMINYK
ncbi:uncharacterized protein VNE69_09109 [Vairimorpha necatrix]|uniref:Uncharacterized protein n=1 Tax=Vairimorpha necatrix TaxID=6039 RepID=A0AAX4JF33_9MICR